MAMNSLRFHHLKKWCMIHLTTVEQEGDERCLWDRLIGPRPGRGRCDFVVAGVVWIEPHDGKSG